MFLRFLFFAFLFYLAFKLIFDFILPVYRTTRQVKKGFREMNQRMQQPSDPHQSRPQAKASAPGAKKSTPGDYIDFEEIKE